MFDKYAETGDRERQTGITHEHVTGESGGTWWPRTKPEEILRPAACTHSEATYSCLFSLVLLSNKLQC